MSYLNMKRLTLDGAAMFLGRTPRQVRRYVDSGSLRAGGGGHGVPLWFRRSDLVAFAAEMKKSNRYRSRKIWSGRIDGCVLSRIAHGVAMRRANPGRMLHYVNSGFSVLWGLPAKTVAGIYRNCLPRAETVPEETSKWATRLATVLSPLELDAIGAMLICRVNPTMALTRPESLAIGAARGLIKNASPELFAKEISFRQTPKTWAAIKPFVVENIRGYPADVLREILDFKEAQFLDENNREAAWAIYRQASADALLQTGLIDIAVWAGDVEGLFSLIDRFYPSLTAVRNILAGLSRKSAAMRRDVSRPPSAYAVAKVLGLATVQTSRIIQSVKRKVDSCDIGRLFAVMDCEPSRAWVAPKPRHISEQPRTVPAINSEDICPECGARLVDGFAVECPDCGASLIGGSVMPE